MQHTPTSGATAQAAPTGPAGPARPSRAGIWRAVAVFTLVTLLVAVALGLVQAHHRIYWWVFDLSSLAPAVGAGVTLLLRRPLRLDAAWRVGMRFTAADLRQTLVLTALGLSIPLLCIQFSAMMRWAREATDLTTLAYPFALPGDIATILSMMSLAVLVMSGLQELGWRCLVQPTLERAYGIGVTGAVIGTLWGLTQPVLVARLAERTVRPSVFEVVMYVGAFVVAHIGMSIALAAVQRRMRALQWLSATLFHWMVSMGLFLILSEEAGRWQPMGAIAICSLLCAGLALFYRRRGQRLRTDATA